MEIKKKGRKKWLEKKKKIDKKNERKRFIKRSGYENRLSEDKNSRSWQSFIQYDKKLDKDMPEIKEEEAEQLEDNNEPLIQNEIVPEIIEKKPDDIIEKPTEDLSPFAAFMRKNNKMNQDQAYGIDYGLKYAQYKNIINDNNSNTQRQKYKKKKRTWK